MIESLSSATATVPSSEERTQKRLKALKLMDDGRPATLAELGDARAELTKNERMKLEKPGPRVWKDVVERYAQGGFSSIDEDDFERFKWIGLYQQRPKDGHFMLRIKVPGGRLNQAQFRVVAGLVRDFGRGIGDITTRQTFQMHWLTIDMLPEIMALLETVGMGVGAGWFGACGDITRNIVSSPLNGLDVREFLDPTELVERANAYFSTAPEYADLPRKFKIGIFGNRAGGQCEINDLALYGTRRSDGEVGYGVLCGGGLSTEPHIGQELNVFVRPEEAMAVMECVTRIFRDHGYRKNRKHARLKYLIADWGAAKLRSEIEKLLGYRLLDAEAQSPAPGYQDQLGVYPQRQPGLSFVGVPVVAGRVTADQMDAVAALAQEFGDGEVRLTVMQNFYLVNVPHARIPQLVERLGQAGFVVAASAIRKGIVACTGIEFCNLAVTETKARAANLVQLLDAEVKWSESEFFRINVNGCPNSCGQHWLADVGLQGCSKKVDGELVEHFDVFLGGALGDSQSGPARYNRRVKRVSAAEVAPAIRNAIEHFQANRQGEESFADFCARRTDDELAEIL